MIADAPVADIIDAHPRAARWLALPFRFFTATARMAGPARLIALHGADGFLAETLAGDGAGAVALVSVGASPSPAVFGDGMARAAEENGWAGVVIDGALRDVTLIRPRALCIAATSVVPFIERDGPAGAEVMEMTVAGVTVRAGDWIVADEDGVIAVDGDLFTAES